MKKDKYKWAALAERERGARERATDTLLRGLPPTYTYSVCNLRLADQNRSFWLSRLLLTKVRFFKLPKALTTLTAALMFLFITFALLLFSCCCCEMMCERLLNYNLAVYFRRNNNHLYVRTSHIIHAYIYCSYTPRGILIIYLWCPAKSIPDHPRARHTRYLSNRSGRCTPHGEIN